MLSLHEFRALTSMSMLTMLAQVRAEAAAIPLFVQSVHGPIRSPASDLYQERHITAHGPTHPNPKPSNPNSSTTRRERERALTSPPTDTSPSPTPPQPPQPHTPPQPRPKSSPASPQQHTNSARPSRPAQQHHPARLRNPSKSPSPPTPPLSQYAHGSPRSQPRQPHARPRIHGRRSSTGSTSARRGGGAMAGAGWLVWRCSCSGRC